MSPNEVLLIRVGIESNSGDMHSPLFDDGRFEYIPIPERQPTTEQRTYDALTGRHGTPFTEYGSHLSGDNPHYDPEFETYTYGDVGKNKRSQLRRLNEDDLLIFYASLDPENNDPPRLFVIGYFTVKQAYDLAPLSETERDKILNRFWKNAHAKREKLTPASPSEADHFPVIVKGKPTKSGLFDRPRPLAREDQYPLASVATATGVSGQLTRAGVARTLAPKKDASIQRWLDDGAVGLINDDTSFFSYVVDSDTGFAPNPYNGYLTLATCKPRIRSVAKPGDWVLGTNPRSAGEEGIVFLAQVDEAMAFNAYYQNERFEAKKPENSPRGDNIYFESADGELQQADDPPAHDSEDDREHDTQTDRILVSSLYWYFGGDSVPVPEHLRGELIHAYGADSRQHHSRTENPVALRELVDLLQQKYRPGMHGQPRDASPEASDFDGC